MAEIDDDIRRPIEEAQWTTPRRSKMIEHTVEDRWRFDFGTVIQLLQLREKEGWELCAVVSIDAPRGPYHRYFFKRERQ